MTYLIIFRSRNSAWGVEPCRALRATANEALRMVDALVSSNERVTIEDAFGRRVESWELLRVAAEQVRRDRDVGDAAGCQQQRDRLATTIGQAMDFRGAATP